MGSDDKAVITGFICRLCSRMNRFVVHIYGDEGVQMQLAQKIKNYLPITVKPNDPLPKTVCLQCIDSLEKQHELMEQFKWARARVGRIAKGEQSFEECVRDHAPRPPDDSQNQQLSSVLVRPSLVSRGTRPSNDISAHSSTSRLSNETSNSSSEIGLNPQRP